MKIIDKKKFFSLQSSKRDGSLMDEVRILQSAIHPNIIRLYDFIETPKTLYVVLELVFGGDLFDRIVAQDGKGFTEEVSRHMFEQMLAAIKYLHSKNIVHRGQSPGSVETEDENLWSLRWTYMSFPRSVSFSTPRSQA
jgi:serine/threonine protein kinase